MEVPQKDSSSEQGASELPPEPRGLYGQRPSRSHDELRRREFARTAAMTARERMIEALALDTELSRLPASNSSRPPERSARS
jgi:hypothetical protein